MARQPPPPIQIKPGKLMPGLSSESAGLANYIVKRDWRRVMEREIRAEGYTGLVLSPSVTSDIQVTPPGSATALTVIAMAKRGDGKRVIVAGNPTTLWAYTGTEERHYCLSAGGESDYFASGSYVDEMQYGWIQIAQGLSTSGRRWEAVAVGDYLCLNNGVDLPVTYRPGDPAAYTIYELREQQIASVGTIAVHDGNLLCMDLWQINDNAFDDLMAPAESALAASQDATGVVSVLAGELFPDATVTPGLCLFWDSGEAVRITSVSSEGAITTDAQQAIAEGTVYLERSEAYGVFADTSKMQRYPWRVLPSMPGLPRRFGATVPVKASLFDRRLRFKYPIRSLPELVRFNQAGGYATSKLVGGSLDIVVLYAGSGGGTLSTSVIAASKDIAMSCLISDPVLYPITYDGDEDLKASLEPLDAADSYAGTFIDLVDDGGIIIKALQLRDQILIYKDTPVVYQGTFTGDTTTPYQFQKVVIANAGQSLHYRNTVVASGGGFYGSCHVYAGREAFYKFDLFTQTPQEIPELQAAQSLFFDGAAQDPENAFVCENPLTREWVWGWTGTGEDRALCYDYAYKTCRTTSAPIAAAARVQHPGKTRNDWLFLFGDDSGGVQRYGLWDAKVVQSGKVTASVTSDGVVRASADFFAPEHVGRTLVFASGDTVAITGYTSATEMTFTGAIPQATGRFMLLPGIWHRNGEPYDSVIESGLGDLGASDIEKLVTRYIPVASSKSQNAVLTIDFKTGINPGSPVFCQSATVPAPQAGHNLVQPTFMGCYIGARLTLGGRNNPFELVQQIWQTTPVNSRSAGRL
jgi:hypothetical protein